MSKTENTKKKKFSRRKFFKRTGIVLGGTAVLLYFGRHRIRRSIAGLAASMDAPSGITDFSPKIWFDVNADNKIVVRSSKEEIGQGTFTGIAMLVAEELEVPVSDVDVVPGGLAGPPDMAGTGGSMSIGGLYIPLRETAATMREMLKEAAATKLNIDPKTVKLNKGYIGSGSKTIALSELTQNWTDWKIPKEVNIKKRSEFKVIGQATPRIDLVPKVMGKTPFCIDRSMPDMLCGAILRSPYLEGKLKSVDASEAEEMPGVVKVVQEKGWVGIVAEKRYQAEMALKKIKVEWDKGKMWQQADLEALHEEGKVVGVTVEKAGKADAMISELEPNALTATYEVQYLAHGQMEPIGTIAHYQEDKIHIIASTQAVDHVANVLKKEFGFSKKNMIIETSFVGGGFGGRHYVFHLPIDALYLSKAVGKPVHLLRTREEEFQSAYVRPYGRNFMGAAFDPITKSIKALRNVQVSGDMNFKNYPVPGLMNLLGADFLGTGHGLHLEYDIPNRFTRIENVETPVNTSIWRGVGCVPNGFARECFLDEIARRLSIDPFDLRLRHLNNRQDLMHLRMNRVLVTLREASNWDAPKEEGIGRGMAIFVDRKTIAGMVAEVKIEEGRYKVTKVTQVLNPAIAINPASIRKQVEGCIMMGISSSITEEVTIKDSQIQQSNYHNYKMAYVADTPEIAIIIQEDGGAERPYGVGEPPIAPVAPSIGNAIFDLTGARLRRLPFGKA